MKHLSPAEIETIRVPEPKHDPFSLGSLVAWLERQDGSTTYNWYDVDACVVCQYLDAVGAKPAVPASNDFPRVHNLGKVFKDHDEYYEVGNGGPNTFGAALTRARAAIASRKGNANG